MKMEIELTDEQAKKVEVLKENGMDIGDAVDALFEMKDMIKDQSTTAVDYRLNKVTQEKAELEKRMEALDEEISFFNKLKDTSLDVDQKFKIVEKEYGAGAKTYDGPNPYSNSRFFFFITIFLHFFNQYCEYCSIFNCCINNSCQCNIYI